MASRALSSCRVSSIKACRAYSTATPPNGGFVKPNFIDVPRPTLGEYKAGVPASTGPKNITRAAKVTTLANGLKVASLTSTDLGASVGLFVNVGSRNETRANSGVTHFLKYTAFTSTTEKPGYQVTREFEAAGATFTATAGREHLIFSSELPPNKVGEVVPLITGMLRPKFAYHEVAAQAETVREDVERLEHDTVSSLFELVHRQAYRSKGLGQPLVAIKDNIHHINQDTLAKFVTDNYGTNQSVFVGVGFDHDELVKAVEKATSNIQSHSSSEKSVEASKYAGGESLVTATGHTHLALAFEGVSLKADSKDALALGVLQHILGSVLNGNAGSQVGTGITSRLAVNILPNNTGSAALSAFNFSYTDSGLFGVYAETRESPSRLVQSIAEEFGKLRSNVGAEELARGKAAFKLSLYDQGSRRTPALEFIGNQVIASGKAVTPEEYAAQVDSITVEDVARVAKKVFSTRPTFVAIGDVSSLPTSESISGVINK